MTRPRACGYVAISPRSQTTSGLGRREVPDDVVTWRRGIGAPHWLWVVELQDRHAATDGPRCVLGEIVIDATSDDQWVNALFGNLPGLTMQWPNLGEDIEIADSAQGDTPYITGCALHVPS